ncbi:TolC family protein [Candidatus Zixiibacteriota bacterium]
MRLGNRYTTIRSFAAIAVLLLLIPPDLVGAQEASMEVLSPGERLSTAIQDAGQSTRSDVTVVMTLNDAIRIALDESYDIFRLKQRYLQLSYSLETVRRSLKTRVNLNSTLPKITQGFANRLFTDYDGTLDLALFKDDILDFGATLNVVQPLITNGSITFSSRLRGYERDLQMIPGTAADLRYISPQFRIQFNQPLLQYNTIKGELKGATLDLEALQLSYGEVELSRLNDVTRAFYALYKEQQELEIVSEIHRQNVENHRAGLRKYELGLISEMEKLNLEVVMVNSRDQMERTRSILLSTRLDFNRHLGLPLSERVWANASDQFIPLEVNPDLAVERALQNRSDMRRATIEVEKVDLDIEKVTARSRPDLQLNLGYDLSGNSTIPGYNKTSDWSTHLSAGMATDNFRSNTNISISLNVPVFDSRTNQTRVQRLISERTVLEREIEEVQDDLHRDVIEQVNEVSSSMQRMEMQSGNRDLARTAFEVSQELFEKGEIDYTELLSVQNRYFQTESLFIRALIDFEMAKAELREITMWDWETDQAIGRQSSPPEPFERGR